MSDSVTTWAETAREKSGLSPEACAAAINRSRPTYDMREKAPGSFTLDEISALYLIYNDEGKNALWDFIKQFKP